MPPPTETDHQQRVAAIAAEALAAEIAGLPGVHLDLDQADMVALVGNLHLAICHPHNNGAAVAWAQALIDRIGESAGPELRRQIAEARQQR